MGQLVCLLDCQAGSLAEGVPFGQVGPEAAKSASCTHCEPAQGLNKLLGLGFHLRISSHVKKPTASTAEQKPLVVCLLACLLATLNPKP